MSKTTTVAFYGCEHAPHTPKRHQDFIIKTIASHKPDIIVHLGDRFDSEAASVWPKESEHSLRDEYEEAAIFSKRVRGAAKKGCQLWWTLGNHDDNIRRADPRRIPKALRDLVDWNKGEFGAEFRMWNQVPYVNSKDGCLNIGPVVAWHGFDTSISSDELESLQVNNLTGGYAHRLFVRAHTHRPMPPTQIKRSGKVLLPYYMANVGTVGPLKPDWASREDTARWGASMLIVRLDTNQTPTPYTGVAVQAPRSATWEAELVTP